MYWIDLFISIDHFLGLFIGKNHTSLFLIKESYYGRLYYIDFNKMYEYVFKYKEYLNTDLSRPNLNKFRLYQKGLLDLPIYLYIQLNYYNF